MRAYFEKKDEAITWVVKKVEEILKRQKIPDFSYYLMIASRISYHRYASVRPPYEATIAVDRDRSRSDHDLPPW